MSGTDAIRVFLTDDHEVVRRGLRELIDGEPGMQVVGDAPDAASTLARVPAVAPDVVVLDVRLEDGNGIEVCRELRARHPGTEVLLLTSYSDDALLVDAVDAGAAGYLLKRSATEEILTAIRRVAAGEGVLDPGVTRSLFERLRAGSREEQVLGALDDREREILALIAESRSNREIAAAVHLAEKTVRNHVSGILRKLGVATRTEAAVLYTRATAPGA